MAKQRSIAATLQRTVIGAALLGVIAVDGTGLTNPETTAVWHPRTRELASRPLRLSHAERKVGRMTSDVVGEPPPAEPDGSVVPGPHELHEPDDVRVRLDVQLVRPESK